VTPSPTSNREVNLLQTSYLEGLKYVPVLSDAMKPATSFAVCYAEAGNATWVANNGTALDLTWRDSNVRLTFSKITYAEVRGVQYHTGGTLPVQSAMTIATLGSSTSLPAIALQGELTPEGANPCTAVAGPGTVPSTGTGRLPMIYTSFGALTQTATLDTSTLSTVHQGQTRLRYALCYEDDADGQWHDSGVRLEVSEISSLFYPTDGHLASGVMTSRDRVIFSDLPRESGAVLPYGPEFPLRYGGSLQPGATLAIVQAKQWYDNPCWRTDWLTADISFFSTGAIAPESSTHPHVIVTQAAQAKLDRSYVDVTTGQTEKVFTVCYRPAGEARWEDSRVNFLWSQVRSVGYIETSHYTTGTYPLLQQLQLTYEGQGSGYYLSLVDATLAAPCTAASAAGGAMKAATKNVTLDTRFIPAKVAVCYGLSTSPTTSAGSAVWEDSGIRLEKPKLYSLRESSTGAVSIPGASGTISNLNSTQLWSYTGSIPNSSWISMVEVSEGTAGYTGNPCLAAGQTNSDRSTGIIQSSFDWTGQAWPLTPPHHCLPYPVWFLTRLTAN